MVKFSDLISRADFEFDIEKDKEGKPVLSLADRQKAYIGGIETYRFPIDLEHVREAVNSAIDRLDIFWNDTLIESIIDSADESEHEALEKRTGDLPCLIDYVVRNRVKVDYDDFEMLKAVSDPWSVDIEEVHRELLKSFPLTRDEIRNYMLKQGTCIDYDENHERYIKEEYIDAWLGFERQFQLTYAVRESMDLIDYDEWQALETTFYGEHSEKLPCYVAATINGVLYEELDQSPLEFVRTGNERIKKLFENMAQYIFERLTFANLSEAEIKNIFTENIGFTDSEYADEIGDFSRPKD